STVWSRRRRRSRRCCGPSHPVRLLEVLVHGHDRGHGLAATGHDPLVLPGIRDDVAARVDPADGGRHVRLDLDQPLPFEFDPPLREGRDLRLETDVHDRGVDVEDLLLQRAVVVDHRPLDAALPLDARDLGVEQDLDRALQDRLDALLHRPELPAAAKISSAISRALSPPPTTITRFPLNSWRSRTRYSTPFPSSSASPGTSSRF